MSRRTRPTEFALVQVYESAPGLYGRRWIGDFDSAAEARDEARRVIDEDDPSARFEVLDAEAFHLGEYHEGGTHEHARVIRVGGAA